MIIIDTREKQPYTFNDDFIVEKLDTGDYTLADYKETLCVERKKSVSEIAGNVTQDRFWREMDRLAEFHYPYLLLEFSQEDVLKFPKGAKIPRFLKRKIRVRGPFIMSRLGKVEDLGIEIVWAGSRFKAKRWLEKLFAEFS